MCKYSPSNVPTTECSPGGNKSSIVATPYAEHKSRLKAPGYFKEHRETPGHIRISRSGPGGSSDKRKMFQQKLVIVIRTFLLFFLFQPSSLVATTVEAGEYASKNELFFFPLPCPGILSTCCSPVFIYLFADCSCWLSFF